MVGLYEYVRTHRAEIDAHIRSVCPNATIFNDAERRQWVLNDGTLYFDASAVGVKL